MSKYVGSKASHAKQLLPIILKDRKQNQIYIEPFAGGFNMIDKVTGKRIANDIDKYITSMFSAVQKGWLPPKIVTEEEYVLIRDNKDKYEPHLVGFAGYCCSFGAKFFGGYARGKTSKGEPRNYALESYNNILKSLPALTNDLVICNMDYRDMPIPNESCIIYCDPPYLGTLGYASSKNFSHEDFWDWCREKSKMGHQVFISEYAAPTDFTVLWEKPVKVSIDSNRVAGSMKSSIEKLFQWKG